MNRWRILSIVGVSFALGALADAGLGWRLAEFQRGLEPPFHVESSAESDVSPMPQGTIGSAAAGGAVVRESRLLIPVDGVSPDDLHDSFADTRGASRSHEAIDIMAPRGTPVRAVEGGTVAKLFTSKSGGLTVYQFDPGSSFAYYYAHLDQYAEGLHEGQAVSRGDLLGYVGSTGNASKDAPHLHFGVFKLGPERQWWKGQPLNPYPLLQ